MKQSPVRTLISIRRLILWGLLLFGAVTGFALLPPANPPLPNLDKRQKRAPQPAALSTEQADAMAELRAQVPNLTVDFEPVTGSPKRVSAVEEFLSGEGGIGKGISAASLAGFTVDDPYRVTKAFLKDHSRLFGYGPEALDQARITREFITAHNGLKTVVWEQQVDGIAVFEAVLISHTTSKGELVNLSSQFVPDPAAAAANGAPNRAALIAAPVVTAPQAVALAAQNVGVELKADGVTAAAEPVAGPEQRQTVQSAGLEGRGRRETDLAADGQEHAALVLGRDLDEPRARGDVPRAGGCADRRSAAAPLPDQLPQRCQLPGLHQRQPVAVFARLPDAGNHPAAAGAPRPGDAPGAQHQRLAARLD